MSDLSPAMQVSERDISHWTDWDDSELLDQAAAACQHPALIEDAIVREAIALNIIAPFRQKLAAMKAKDNSLSQDEFSADGSFLGSDRELQLLRSVEALVIERDELRAALVRPPETPISDDVRERVARAIYFDKLNRSRQALGMEAIADTPEAKPSGHLWGDSVAAADAALSSIGRVSTEGDGE